MNFLRKITKVWVTLGEYIGNTIAIVVLALVFFLLIGSASFMAMIFRSKKKNEKGFWREKRYVEPTLQNLGHLF